MNPIDRDRARAIRAHRDVVATLQHLTDEQVRQPSRLPDWTVGHVATHIARNAEGHVRMFDAAMRSKVAEMYPGGPDQRTGDIEAGSRRSAVELLGDVAATAAELEARWAAMPDGAWTGRGITFAGESTMSDLLFMRWRETTVHHADLGLDFAWSDWEPEYVRAELARLTMLWASRKPMGLTALPPESQRVGDHQRVAWLLGRAEIEGLGEAGINA